jgi:hypothetical protein
MLMLNLHRQQLTAFGALQMLVAFGPAVRGKYALANDAFAASFLKAQLRHHLR